MSLSKSLVADATKRYCACTILSELAPEEIWRYMLQFVEDIDLHTLAKVCHTFRRFSADPVLWRRVVLHRNSFRLQLRFALPQRPSRIELASRGILRSSSSSQILARHIDEGRYVNGPLGVQNFRAGRAVERTFTRSALGRLLLARPDVDELCNRGVFSEDVAASFKASCPSKHNKYAPSSPAVRVISPRLLPKMTVLRSALRRDKLKHSLQNRKSFQEIRDLNVTKRKLRHFTHAVFLLCNVFP
ncbi:spermidine resistance protein [Batrachochytrium dendrobatidis]